mmetsp:Transcript_18423/g.32278  ORF Transcript_18423/g.32278 Transcript_18423/m.32278 type:complete len:84 (+) Transcript_18423:1074-1325(+)
MLWTCSISCDEGQVDVSLDLAGEFDLRCFGSLSETLQGKLILGQVNALRFLKLVSKPLSDRMVKVLATERSVSVCSLHFKDTA